MKLSNIENIQPAPEDLQAQATTPAKKIDWQTWAIGGFIVLAIVVGSILIFRKNDKKN